MRHVFFTGFLIAGLGVPALADSADVTWPDCYCTDKTGARIEMGQEICMYVDGRSFTARCEMSLNNPMWRETGDSCLSSRNSGSEGGSPSFDAGPVHA